MLTLPNRLRLAALTVVVLLATLLATAATATADTGKPGPDTVLGQMAGPNANLDAMLNQLAATTPGVRVGGQGTSVPAPGTSTAGTAGGSGAAPSTSFAQGLAAARAQSQGSLSSALPDPCGAAALTTMANGDPAATKSAGIGNSSCGDCVAQGLSQHSQMNRVMDPTQTQLLQTTSSNTLTEAGLEDMPDWLRTQLSAQNGNVLDETPPADAAPQAAPKPASAPGGCGGQQASSSDLLNGLDMTK